MEEFIACFADNLQSVVAIDGKTLRRSFDRAGSRRFTCWVKFGIRVKSGHKTLDCPAASRLALTGRGHDRC